MALGDWTRPIGGTLPFWSGLSTCTVWLSPLPFSAMPKRKTPRSALIRQWTLNSPCYRIDGETVFCQPCGKKVSRRVFTWRECFMCYSKPRPLDQVRLIQGPWSNSKLMQSCPLRRLGWRLGVMAAIRCYCFLFILPLLLRKERRHLCILNTADSVPFGACIFSNVGYFDC